MNMSIEEIEWTATILSLAGAIMLSTNMTGARWAWPVWLVSNIFWIWFGCEKEAYGLVLTQIGFTVTSLIGVYRCFYRECREPAQPAVDY